MSSEEETVTGETWDKVTTRKLRDELIQENEMNARKMVAEEAVKKYAADLLEMLKMLRRERLAPGSPFYKAVTKLIDKAEGRA